MNKSWNRIKRERNKQTLKMRDKSAFQNESNEEKKSKAKKDLACM